MADDAIDLNDPGMFELARRLEAYADARLAPSVAVTTRMRTSVMNAAHRRAALGPDDRTFVATATPAADRRGAGARTWRRPAVAILAASLAVAMFAGTVSATKPGGPLYATRLWIEMANLPAEVVARAQAEINRLDARLLEAQQASSAGDGPAAMAALSAYSIIVVEAARGSAGNATASAAIEVTVTSHVVVLTLMIDSVPLPARDAVQDALSSSSKVLDDLDDAGQQGSQGLPNDATTSTARGPDGAEPGLSTPANDTEPGVAAGQGDKPEESVAPEESDAPEKSGAPENSGPVRSPDVPRPAQAGTGGASKNDPTARPTRPPAVRKGAGPDKDGGT